ncbi:MAG: phosphate acyltransferase PlsX [Planctomyces sp.]|nr:phosphate acyltransferase PlsX [Planctomyces sp.]MBA4039155.1 phosphate acyltransferase PlsX [Planctomyces sp.]MBA4119559.1 phosphate acyltransferase PlsX [Isosphaera sp.]
MRLGVDVMGGDHAPDEILKGCVRALSALDPGDELVLIGDEASARDFMLEAGVRDDRLRFVHTTQSIEMAESPVEAVRTKTDSSIVRMARLGAYRHRQEPLACDAVLSAGNTGACVSAATLHMRRLPGVHRPGITVTIPTFNGPVVLCDAGANPEPRPAHLWQYGIMAEVVSRIVHGRQSPRVAVMNIGAEEAKGTDLIQGTAALIRATPGIRYVGYIEGRDLFEGVADVVVTDGLVGNTLLKMAEGLARSLISGISAEVLAADPDLMLRLEPIFREMFRKNDYHEHGGAPLLGVGGVCMIAHGSSNARSISAALREARAIVKAGINDALVARIAELTPQAPDEARRA